MSSTQLKVSNASPIAQIVQFEADVSKSIVATSSIWSAAKDELVDFPFNHAIPLEFPAGDFGLAVGLAATIPWSLSLMKIPPIDWKRDIGAIISSPLGSMGIYSHPAVILSMMKSPVRNWCDTKDDRFGVGSGEVLALFSVSRIKTINVKSPSDGTYGACVIRGEIDFDRIFVLRYLNNSTRIFRLEEWVQYFQRSEEYYLVLSNPNIHLRCKHASQK